MRPAYLVTLGVAALITATTWTSARGFADDPPGWAFQKRGIIEANGYNPFRYRYGYRFYGRRGAYAWTYGHHRRFHHRYRYW